MANEASFTDTIGRLLSVTKTTVEKMITDVVSANIPMIHYFVEEGKVKEGGSYLEGVVLKEEVPAIGLATSASGLTPGFQSPTTKYRYAWKNIYAPFAIPGPDIRKNEGAAQHIDLFATHMAAGTSGLTSGLGGTTLGIWGSALNDESSEAVLTSLLNIVKSSAVATGTTGSLSRTPTWWRSILNTDGAVTSYATNGLTRTRGSHFAARRGNQKTDVCVTTRAALVNFYAALQATFNYNIPLEYRLSGRRTIDVGLDDVGFHGAILMDDANCEASTWRGLNTSSIYLVKHDKSFMSFSPFESMLNRGYDGVQTTIICMLNLVCSDLARQYCQTGVDTA